MLLQGLRQWKTSCNCLSKCQITMFFKLINSKYLILQFLCLNYLEFISSCFIWIYCNMLQLDMPCISSSKIHTLCTTDDSFKHATSSYFEAVCKLQHWFFRNQLWHLDVFVMSSWMSTTMSMRSMKRQLRCPDVFRNVNSNMKVFSRHQLRQCHVHLDAQLQNSTFNINPIFCISHMVCHTSYHPTYIKSLSSHFYLLLISGFLRHVT